jgi:hypothetical protein
MTETSGLKGRDSIGRYTRTPESAERDAEACRMKARGISYPRIAEELGYGDRHNARRAVNAALAAIPAEAAEDLRAVQMLQLEIMTEKAMEALEAVHYEHSQAGKLMLNPDGSFKIDYAPRYAAIDRMVKIQERVAKLNPGTEPAAAGGISDDALDAEYARLVAAYGEPEA